MLYVFFLVSGWDFEIRIPRERLILQSDHNLGKKICSIWCAKTRWNWGNTISLWLWRSKSWVCFYILRRLVNLRELLTGCHGFVIFKLCDYITNLKHWEHILHEKKNNLALRNFILFLSFLTYLFRRSMRFSSLALLP